MAKNLKDSIGEIKYVHCTYDSRRFTEHFGLKALNDEYVLLTTNISTITPKKGESLKVFLYCSNGIFRFETTVLRTEESFPYQFWFLKLPKDFEVTQQRNFYRTVFCLSTVVTVNFYNGEKKLIPCNAYDISGNGISLIVSPKLHSSQLEHFLSKPNFDQYAKFTICIKFPNRDINTVMKFIHKRTLSKTTNTMIYAFKFETINPSDCEFITKQCLAKQLSENQKKNFDITKN